MEHEIKIKNIADDRLAKSVNNKQKVKKHKKKKNSPLVPILCLVIGGLLGIIGTTIFYDEQFNFNPVNREKVDAEENVELSQSALKENGEEYFVIETPEGHLFYPLKWQDQVRVEQHEGEVYTVNFYGTIGDKGEQFLFSIILGGGEGTHVGTWNDTPVYITTTLENVTEAWTTEEMNLFYSMQEDVNFVLEMLQKEEGFVSAI